MLHPQKSFFIEILISDSTLPVLHLLTQNKYVKYLLHLCEFCIQGQHSEIDIFSMKHQGAMHSMFVI